MSRDEMVSLYIRCSTDESICCRWTLDVQRMSQDGPSTPRSYSSRPSTPPSYSLRTSRNAECSNCKLLLGKIKVLETTVEMYMHLEQHTFTSTALLCEVYNDMEKLGLE
nr:hypothetical protein [Tanacetum cinerariifolium]